MYLPTFAIFHSCHFVLAQPFELPPPENRKAAVSRLFVLANRSFIVLQGGAKLSTMVKFKSLKGSLPPQFPRRSDLEHATIESYPPAGPSPHPHPHAHWGIIGAHLHAQGERSTVVKKRLPQENSTINQP